MTNAAVMDGAAGMAGAAANGSVGASAAGGLIGMLASLVVVLLVIFALAWLLRRLQSTSLARGALVRVHGGVPVGQKERVLVIESGGQQFLIGVAPGGVNLIHRFEAPIVEADAPAATPAFAEKLAQVLKRGKSA